MEIKFVSYDGDYPCLCGGTLILNIDGEDYYFGDFGENFYFGNFGRVNKDSDDHHFKRFWMSGGGISIDEEITIHAKWKLKEYCLPDFLLPYGQELIDLFNENVRYGCCGGCI